METKERGRHRLGGKHSDPIIVPERKKPSGRRAATPVKDAVIPPPPAREPTVHTGQVDTVAVPAETGMIRVVKHKGRFNTLAAIATGGLLVVSGGAAYKPPTQSHRGTDLERTAEASDLEIELGTQDPITVPIDILMDQEKVQVTTKPAPLPKPAPVIQRVVEAPAPPVVAQAPAPAPVVAPKPVVKVKPVPAPAPIISSNKSATIASAALGQLGVRQDCTRLVSNALAAAGIKHHGWPVSYYSVGRAVSAAEAIPGDLIYYQNGGMGLAHIAVYIGNGQAVHGGWNGNQTVVFKANVGSGPQFIRV